MLTNFRSLNDLSWKGLMLATELESLSESLLVNAKILETQELDSIDWKDVNNAWRGHHDLR